MKRSGSLLCSSAILGIFGVIALTGCSTEAEDAGSSAANATERKSVELAAVDGTKLSLTYDVMTRDSSSDHRTSATRVVLRVANPAWSVGGASGNHAVRAVLMSFCAPSGGGAEGLAYNHDLDVPFTHLSSGSGFGYEIQLATRGDEIDNIPMFMTSIAGANHCRQEIAVVVDGNWLVDPINKTHNFQFGLDH